MRRALTTIALAAAVGVAVAGTGAAAGHRATVKTRHGDHGTYLVDAKGRTLYLFEADKTRKSTCTGACAKFWPPLLTRSKPSAGTGLNPRLVGTTRRANGSLQVTYNRHPLYTSALDKAAGQANGQRRTAFGGRWYAVSARGTAVVGTATTTTISTTTSTTTSTETTRTTITDPYP
jgi:predicted lipoprotein with Yx(FWY)xxD motif